MIKKLLITLFFTLLFGNLSFAAGGDGGSTKSDYDKAVKLIKSAKKYETDGKIKKADDRYKKAFKLLIKSNKITKISQIEVRDWLKNITVPNNIYFSVDIDPYNFY